MSSSDEEVQEELPKDPTTVEEDDAAIEYFASKLGLGDEEWDNDMQLGGYSAIFEGITVGKRKKSTIFDETAMVKKTRTVEEEEARKEFTGLLNRIAPSNFAEISQKIKMAYASHNSATAAAVFSRCITQRINTDSKLLPVLMKAYAGALKMFPDALEKAIQTLKPFEGKSENVAPFFDLIGSQTVQAISTDDLDPELKTLNIAARKLAMNSDVRRNLFFAITTGADFVESYAKILKLNLSKSQRHEVPLVIIECVGKEAKYNPFYATLTLHIMDNERNFARPLISSIRNSLRLMDSYSTPMIRNTALFVFDLLKSGQLDLSFAKGEKLMTLGPKPVLFYKILFKELFLHFEPEELFASCRSSPDFAADIAEFLSFYVKPFIMKSPECTKAHLRLLKRVTRV